jgi:uncharacterized protein YjbI with pentapeptide repeats
VTSPTPTTDRGKARRTPSRVIWASIGIIGGATLILGTLGSPGGLGINGDQTIKVERDRNWRVIKYSIDRSEGRTAWDWLGLIGVPATLAALGIWFQSQEQKRASQEAKEQRRLVAEENKEETLQRYFDRVAQLLIEKDLIGLSSSSEQPSSIVESSSNIIRARTLSVLRSFSDDGDRKASVVLFLYETEILQALKVSLLNANLSAANLCWTNFSGAYLREAGLREAKLCWANLSRANLSKASLSRADLSEANLNNANLSGASLFKANLCWANLSEANFSGAYLREACLIKAYSTGANLSNAELREANLRRASLSRANLSGANLNNANLSQALLISADLIRADLSAADLSAADLREANLSGSNLQEVRWDEETEWPDKAAFKGAKNIPPELKKQLGLD